MTLTQARPPPATRQRQQGRNVKIKRRREILPVLVRRGGRSIKSHKYQYITKNYPLPANDFPANFPEASCIFATESCIFPVAPTR
jgi:hypothetical protein